MAIEKVNLYLPGQNLTNLALNVDYDRLGFDLTDISVTFNHPNVAQITVKVGSMWECNGNRYKITGTDIVFNQANINHNYIVFTDNPSPAFTTAANPGLFNPVKQGVYQADNITRTLKWFISAGIIGKEFFCIDSVRANQEQSEKIKATQMDCFNTRENLTTWGPVVETYLNGTPSGGVWSYPTGFHYSKYLRIKKPVMAELNARLDTTSGANTIRNFFQLSHNNKFSFREFAPWPGVEFSTENKSYIMCLAPGLYRLRMLLATNLFGFPELYLRCFLYGVYGSENFPENTLIGNESIYETET